MSASTLASEGGQLTQDAVSGMENIVGDSHKIGCIADVIEEFAFQTHSGAERRGGRARADEHGWGPQLSQVK